MVVYKLLYMMCGSWLCAVAVIVDHVRSLMMRSIEHGGGMWCLAVMVVGGAPARYVHARVGCACVTASLDLGE